MIAKAGKVKQASGSMPTEMAPSDSLFDSLQEHECGERTLRIEFYKSPEDLYFVWPYVRLVQGDKDAMKHFQVRGQFADKAQAREAALVQGRELIANGFDLNSTD